MFIQYELFSLRIIACVYSPRSNSIYCIPNPANFFFLLWSRFHLSLEVILWSEKPFLHLVFRSWIRKDP
jgi:hypothetical protein